MSPRHFPTVIASAVLFVAATGAAQAQDEGVKQIEQLIKRAKSQVEAISDAKQQLQKTMTAYNAVLAPDVKDRRDATDRCRRRWRRRRRNARRSRLAAWN